MYKNSTKHHSPFFKALCACGLSTAFMMSTNAAAAGEISHIDVHGDNIILYFDDVVEDAAAFTLTGPNRIAVDIRGATAKPTAQPFGQTTYDMVRTVRKGQFDNRTARVVLDLGRPAKIEKGSFSSDGRKLHLSMSPVSWNQMDNGTSKIQFTPPAQYRAKPPSSRNSVRVKLPPAGKKMKLPPIAGPNDDSRPLVVIDAGHGGHDPGAISPHNGKREKDITLAIARTIRDELLQSGRVRVALTRDQDDYLILEERYGIARRLNADLFISIHADAAGSHDAHGATIYTLSEVASDREASKLAARENKSDIINGINLASSTADVSSILIDLTQRETMNLSSDFARTLRRAGDDKMTFRSNSHRFASFVVLKAPDVPSILLETGYLTNRGDMERLSSKAGQRQIGRSVADAVTLFFARKLAQR